VFLFASETETFGNVTLEALASGLAVVAYDYAAAGLHVTHGETGVLVPYAERGAFVAAAARLVQAPRLLEAIRGRAREAVASADWQRVVDRFEALLTGASCAPVQMGAERG
jgi:glycosyltransferase involved in cell wall biosynthesis